MYNQVIPLEQSVLQISSNSFECTDAIREVIVFNDDSHAQIVHRIT